MNENAPKKIEEQLKRFEILLHSWAGQWFPESRRPELRRAYLRALKTYGRTDDGDGFLDQLEANPSETLKKNVIQEVLVGETYFFRDPALWVNLENIIIPDIINQKINSKNMRVWCAGCSTGEEAYSLALTLHQAITSIDSWKINILATDISEQSLTKARLGMYGQRAIREIDEQRWKNYYYRYEQDIQIKENIKRLITFQQGNLSDLNYPDIKTMGTDLILCRNVLIYFDRELVLKVISKFGRCLSPNGWLLLAPTEVPLNPPPGLKVQALPYNFLALRPETAAATPFTDLALLRTVSEPAVAKTGLFETQQHPFANTGKHVQALLNAKAKGDSGTASSKGKSPANSTNQRVPNAVPTASYAPSPTASCAVSPCASPNTPAPAGKETEAGALSASLSELEFASKLLQAKAEADRGNLHEALAAANKCTKANSTDARGWLLLGIIQDALRLYNKAVESFKRAVYLNNSLAVAHIFLARTMYRLGSNDYMTEVRYFRKLTADCSPSDMLDAGGGITVREACVIADKLEKISRSGKEGR